MENSWNWLLLTGSWFSIKVLILESPLGDCNKKNMAHRSCVMWKFKFKKH